MWEKLETLTQNFYDEFQKNSLKVYLVAANIALILFALIFANTGMLPFKTLGDFAFFGVLALILAIYRPGWSFLFFVGSLALENINLAPAFFGLALRPYQFMGLITIVAIAVGFLTKRLSFTLPKWRWQDALILVFVIGGFLSALTSANRGLSFKQAIIAASFAALYFMVRIYIQSFADLKRIAPFLLSSGAMVSMYGIWQNVRFGHGANSFEVMPGRPNATFTEADWLGIFITFILACLFSWLYSVNRNYTKDSAHQIFNFQFSIFNKFFNFQFLKKIGVYIFIILTMIVLILTVSRSAWLGAVIVALGFLKITLLYGTENVAPIEEQKGFWHEILLALKGKWNWRGFSQAFLKLIAMMLISVGVILIFHLTTFQLGNRAVSTGGLQKITVACSLAINPDAPPLQAGAVIKDLEELNNKYGCRHINLEDINNEIARGYGVFEVYRPDPNVGIRAKIYQQSINQIKSHPILGIGWGSISKILGTDDRGAGLNASDIFLETWLGAGILGIASLVILLGYIFGQSCKVFVKSRGEDFGAVFLLLGLFAIVMPNLFNSGIFLGFVWAYLAVAVSLLVEKKKTI